MPAIEIRGLEKRYGKHIGIRNVTFSVDEGEILGFVGPNGAGKSTTIKSLMGFIFPDAGTATICGYNTAKDSKTIKAFTGYVPSEVRLYPSLSVGELLRRNAGFYSEDCGSETARLCSLFEIDTKKRFRELSSGNKKKVSIVCALMAGPRVIILDEPTNGLDPVMQKRLFEELHSRTQAGATVLLSSHNLAEVQEYCRRVAFIRDGTILAVTDLSADMEAAKLVTVAGGHCGTPKGFEFLRSENNVRVFRTVLNGTALLDAVGTLAPEDITIENESIEARFWSLYGQEKQS
ncbi:ABC transporter ATP-binding protein [Oscillospiraceae bacterium OttesenSCG-928-F05]|nr:ABC transporter ATP-binding protein [Oscillospiraceae bacterium OttesenSCG-928-F05]